MHLSVLVQTRRRPLWGLRPSSPGLSDVLTYHKLFLKASSWKPRSHTSGITTDISPWAFKVAPVVNNQPANAGDLISSVQLLSCVWLFATPWTAAHQASLFITNPQSPPKPMSIELVMPSNKLILCHPFLLLPSIFPSIRRLNRHGLNPWVGKIPWREAWWPTPVFLSGESYGQKNLAGYSPWSCKESDMTEVT